MDYSSRVAQLSDVIAPDRKTTVSILGNFKKVVKEGDLRMHPIIARLVDKETLERMGAKMLELNATEFASTFKTDFVFKGGV